MVSTSPFIFIIAHCFVKIKGGFKMPKLIVTSRYIKPNAHGKFIAPVIEFSVAHSLRVLTLQRNNVRPECAVVIRNLFCCLIQHNGI